MMVIALELAAENPAYEDVASKFFEHFVYIARAMNDISRVELWDEEDGFYYDVLRLPDGRTHRLRIRSMVGLIPLFAAETLEPEMVARLTHFKRRIEWFIENRPEFRAHLDATRRSADGERRLLSLVPRGRLRRILGRMLDEQEFLSPHGIRALSAYHRGHPYVFEFNGQSYRVDYEPAESSTGLFGGNSNWRGPVWMPLNFLLIEALQRLHWYYGYTFQVEFPTDSGRLLSLWEVSQEISRRVSRIFLRQPDDCRPVYGRQEPFQSDPHWRDLVLFHEYFNGDTGEGVGASHQTGWTGLVAKLLQQSGE
jgi:hypothetical protein